MSKRENHGGGDKGSNKKAKYYVRHRLDMAAGLALTHSDSLAPQKSSGTGPNPDRAIPNHTRGVIVTSESFLEHKAIREASLLFEEHYDKLQKESQGGASTSASAAADEGAAEKAEASKDISALLAAEVADLKDKSKHRFKHHETGIKGVQYVSFPADGPSPQEVVVSVMKEAKATMTLRARNCSRFLPVSHTCFASVEAIKEMAPKVLEGHFPAEEVEGQKGVQFAVEYEHRSFQGINRLDIINAFTDQIKCPPNKVNLNSPEKTILVQMLKSVCAVSIVTGYKELCKFNIKNITEPSKDEKPKEKKEEAKKEEAKKETEPEMPKEI